MKCQVSSRILPLALVRACFEVTLSFLNNLFLVPRYDLLMVVNIGNSRSEKYNKPNNSFSRPVAF